MTPFPIPKQSVNVSPLCSEHASKYTLEEGLNSIFKQALKFVCQNWSEGHVFSWKLVLPIFIMISKKLKLSLRILLRSGTVEPKRALSCPILQHGGLYQKLKGGIQEIFFFLMFPLHSRLLQTSHKTYPLQASVCFSLKRNRMSI